MGTTKDFGNYGENLAAKFLAKQGFTILSRNFVTNVGEIDIIALEDKKTRKKLADFKLQSKEQQKQEIIVFVEVKSRHTDLVGKPSEAVDKRKQNKYEIMAKQFISKCNLDDINYRFDIIEVLNDGKINHIINAF